MKKILLCCIAGSLMADPLKILTQNGEKTALKNLIEQQPIISYMAVKEIEHPKNVVVVDTTQVNKKSRCACAKQAKCIGVFCTAGCCVTGIFSGGLMFCGPTAANIIPFLLGSTSGVMGFVCMAVNEDKPC